MTWSVTVQPGVGSSGVVTIALLRYVPGAALSSTRTDNVTTTGPSATWRSDALMMHVKAVSPMAPVQEFPEAGLTVGGAAASTKPAGNTSVTVAATLASDGPALSIVNV